MKHLKVAYILSWFGIDDKIKKSRRRFHQKQVEWFLEKGLELVILPQQYKKDDYIRDNKITYLPSPSKLLRPASGLNQFLSGFYSSDYDYVVTAGNDSVLDDYNLGNRCIEDFDNIIYPYGHNIDLFVPAYDGFGGMPRLDIKSNPILQDHYVFCRTHTFKGSITFMRNIKKEYNLEIYYDTYFDVGNDGEMLIGEDTDFGLQFILHGLGAYKCKSIILKEFGDIKKSTWQRENRHDDIFKTSEYFCEKYKKYNVKMRSDNVFTDHSHLLKYYFKRPTKIEIPIDKKLLSNLLIQKPTLIKYNTKKWIV